MNEVNTYSDHALLAAITVDGGNRSCGITHLWSSFLTDSVPQPGRTARAISSGQKRTSNSNSKN